MQQNTLSLCHSWDFLIPAKLSFISLETRVSCPCRHQVLAAYKENPGDEYFNHLSSGKPSCFSSSAGIKTPRRSREKANQLIDSLRPFLPHPRFHFSASSRRQYRERKKRTHHQSGLCFWGAALTYLEKGELKRLLFVFLDLSAYQVDLPVLKCNTPRPCAPMSLHNSKKVSFWENAF